MTVKVATSATNFTEVKLPRVYVDGVWKCATAYVRAEGTWKSLSLPVRPSGVTKQWEFKLCSNYPRYMVGGLNGCYVLATNNILYYVNSSGSVVWTRDVGTPYLAFNKLTIYTGSDGVERVCVPRREDKRIMTVNSSGDVSIPITWSESSDPYVCMGRDCIYASRDRNSVRTIGKYNLSGATVWEYTLNGWIGRVTVTDTRIFTFEGQMLFYIDDIGSMAGSPTNTGERVGTIAGTGELGQGYISLITDGNTGRNYYGTKVWTSTSSLTDAACDLKKAYGVNSLCCYSINALTGNLLYKIPYDPSTVAIPLKADSKEVYVAGCDGMLAKFTCA